jgi:uncharacterized protein YabE (DUF348 family)
MNVIIRQSARSIGAFVVAALALVLLILIATSNSTHAVKSDDSNQDGRIITIHDRGQEKVVITQETTVGDALAEANIEIDANDAVEPSRSTKLVASDYQINIYRARPVIIIDGNVRTRVVTPYQTAAQIAKSVGIKLYDEDKTSIERTDDIIAEGAGLKLVIQRATAFNFTLYGRTASVRTQGATVREMLAEKNIVMGESDKITPRLDTQITSGMTIRLWREGKQTITVDESVNFETETIEDADQSVGYLDIQVPGKKGMKSVTYEVIIQDGKEVSRKQIASLITKKPSKQIEVVGVKGEYTTPSENENITWAFLTSHGFSRVQAAGIMGNLMQEHHFNTTGDGLAQWNGARRDNLYSRPYPNNIYTQLNFLIEELNGGYSGVRDAIKSVESSNDPKNVVIIFQNQFEKCNPYYCMQDQRIEFARDILASH